MAENSSILLYTSCCSHVKQLWDYGYVIEVAAILFCGDAPLQDTLDKTWTSNPPKTLPHQLQPLGLDRQDSTVAGPSSSSQLSLGGDSQRVSTTVCRN